MNAEKKKNLKKFGMKVAIVAAVILAVGIVISLNSKSRTIQTKSTQFGLKDVGQLETQEAYVTVIVDDNTWRDVYGVNIPLTNTHFIYSYDVVVTAGFEFGDVYPIVDEEAKTVTVNMPETTILRKELLLESQKVYLEDESMFNQNKLTENNEQLIQLENQAVADAEANGIYESAKANAERLITSFCANTFDPAEYEYIFKY